MTELLRDPGIYVVIGFFSFFLGYAIGRRQGRGEGLLEGVRLAPLEMRRQMWEKGRCVLCGAMPGSDGQEPAETQATEARANPSPSPKEPRSSSSPAGVDRGAETQPHSG